MLTSTWTFLGTGVIPAILAFQDDAGGAAEPAAAEPQATGLDLFGGLAVPMLGCFAVFYFLLLRPQKKQRQEQARRIGELRKNDTVYTRAGIVGKIISIDPEKNLVVLKIDEQNNVRMRVLRDSIESVFDEKTPGQDASSSSQPEKQEKQKEKS